MSGKNILYIVCKGTLYPSKYYTSLYNTVCMRYVHARKEFGWEDYGYLNMCLARL